MQTHKAKRVEITIEKIMQSRLSDALVKADALFVIGVAADDKPQKARLFGRKNAAQTCIGKRAVANK